MPPLPRNAEAKREAGLCMVAWCREPVPRGGINGFPICYEHQKQVIDNWLILTPRGRSTRPPPRRLRLGVGRTRLIELEA